MRLTAVLLATVLATSVAAAAVPASPDAALRHANALLARNPVIDGHNDLPMVIRETWDPPGDLEAQDLRRRTPGDTDIERLRRGHVGAQFWSVFVPSSEDARKAGWARFQLEQIDLALRLSERYPDVFTLALTADDIEAANRAGRIASLLGMEGGHTLENSLGALRAYYRLGVRYMTLTHVDNTDWAEASTGRGDKGLTPFGRELIGEMNRLGMLVDLSHVSPKTMTDVLDVTAAPVIFSHSNAKALTPNERNVPDDVLRRLPVNGGIVMASFVNHFNVDRALQQAWDTAFREATGGLDPYDRTSAEALRKFAADHPRPRATIANVADHIEHLRAVAGIDHVGIGSDFYGAPESMAQGLEDTSAFPLVFAELIRRGWRDADLVKLARGNVLRVMRANEAVAARLRKARAASIETIEALDR